MAAPNRVFASALIKTLSVKGRQISLEYATETPAWRRVYLSPVAQEGFAEAMEKAIIPEDTAKAVMRESLHPSQNDDKGHFTVDLKDTSGNHLGTVHVYPKKEEGEKA